MTPAKLLLSLLVMAGMAFPAAFAGDNDSPRDGHKPGKDSKWGISLDLGSGHGSLFGRHGFGGRIVIGRPSPTVVRRRHHRPYDRRWHRRRYRDRYHHNRRYYDYRYDDYWDEYEEWVPAHWEIVIETRWVPGHWEEVWVEDDYYDPYYYKGGKGKSNAAGKASPGHYEKRWVPGRNVQQKVKKWVPGRYEKKAGKRTDARKKNGKK